MINYKKPKNISLRELTDDGLIKFFNVINEINELKRKKIKNYEKVLEIVKDLPVVDDDYSRALFNAPSIDLTLTFKDRYYFAEYLHKNINNFIKEKSQFRNWGLWGWLALSYIEILTNNFKNVLEKYQYLPDAGINRGSGVPLLYRHSVRESYLLYDNYKEESKIYFSRNSMSKMTEFQEQTRGYSKIRRHKSMHAYLVKKYRDPNTGYLIKGASSKVEIEKNLGRSSVRRIGPLYDCLSVSYASPLLTAPQLGELLGKGFEID